MLKSTETKGASSTSRTPDKSAFLNASLTCVTVTFCSKSTTKSTRETFLLVLLKPFHEVYLQLQAILLSALAAPVDVGIILSLQERALLKSLCGLSIFFDHLLLHEQLSSDHL